MTVLKTRTVVIFKAYSDFYNIHGPSMTLRDLPRSLWTLHDLHGNTMTLIDLSLTSRQSMNLTRHSLILLEPHEPSMTLMDLTWTSWTRHDLHGNTMTLIDPSSISRPSMNPTRTSLKPPCSSWTLQGPHGPCMTLPYLNLINLNGNKGDLALCDVVSEWVTLVTGHG